MPEKKTPLHRRIRPAVPVTLDVDGEKVVLNLSFDMNALARIEEKTGLKLVGNIFTLWMEMSSAKVLAAVFWATAVNHHPEFDSKEGYHNLVSLLDGENFEPVSKALAEAYPLMLPKRQAELFRETVSKAKEEQEENPSKPGPAPAESSAGSISGPSPDLTSASRSASSGS